MPEPEPKHSSAACGSCLLRERANRPSCLRCTTEQLLAMAPAPVAPPRIAPRQRAFAIACLVVTAACWGSAFRLTEVALHELAPLEVTFLRCLIGVLTIGAVIAVHPGAAPARSTSTVTPRRDAWRALLIGGVFTGIAYATIALGQVGAASTTTGVILGTVPVWTALLALLVSRSAPSAGRRPSPRLLAALVLGTLAAVIPAVADHASTPPWAVALLLGAAISHGVSMVSIQPAVLRFGPLRATAGVTLLSLLLVTPAWVLGTLPSMPSAGVVAAVLALGVLPTGLAYVTFFEAVRRLGARTAALAVYLIPAFALLVGWLSDPVLVGPATLLGAAVGALAVALGVTSSEPADSPQRSPFDHRRLPHPTT